jgi:2-polyprenyl-6-methoxyphenol hydroxylase-like FAD-dependent oxidoreductase
VRELPLVVLGSGPAALSLSVALTGRGLDVVLVAPQPDARWPQTFGMWTDQWPAALAQETGLVNPWRHVWDQVLAFGERKHEVGRTYAILENERVQ